MTSRVIYVFVLNVFCRFLRLLRRHWAKIKKFVSPLHILFFLTRDESEQSRVGNPERARYGPILSAKLAIQKKGFASYCPRARPALIIINAVLTLLFVSLQGRLAMTSNKRLEDLYSLNYCFFLLLLLLLFVVPHCNRQLILLLISLQGWGEEKVPKNHGTRLSCAPTVYIC